jgi:negative regulator of flagellin synthesis FlgM
MLTSSGPKGVSPVGLSKTYYSKARQGAAGKTSVSPGKYDSATFSRPMEGESAFQMELVSRLSHEVRTSTTTGDIQELRRQVASGQYRPDPMAIAGRMLFSVED